MWGDKYCIYEIVSIGFNRRDVEGSEFDEFEFVSRLEFHESQREYETWEYPIEEWDTGLCERYVRFQLPPDSS
jgi:hypothetical protein